MKIFIAQNPKELGKMAADKAEACINAAIRQNGNARILLATGQSQFETLEELVNKSIDWSKVEGFHLDEYLGLAGDHPASFRRYLFDRFVSRTKLKKMYYIEGDGNIPEIIAELTKSIREAPVDIGLVGIGENAHIAFNDPPADFESAEAYKVVELDNECRRQQFREGWFRTPEEVPSHAISMTVKEILKCKTIVSSVPHKVKANAVKRTLQNKVSEYTPATILKTHGDWNLYLDENSSSLIK
ncbi:glucosamine-6-phosphate deaminase [Candidatus Nomurabacteria bacterium]|nr:glucosamine-6-phosphate deaminase [Candidatus Nomurabacteria bacterium]